VPVNARVQLEDAAAEPAPSELEELKAFAVPLSMDQLDAEERTHFFARLTHLAKARPSPELASLVERLLELPALRRERNPQARRKVLESQLALGFPWALELKPEDLDLVLGRDEVPRVNQGWLVGLALLSLTWTGWAFTWLEQSLLAGHLPARDGHLALFVLAGVVHAALAVTAALRGRRGTLLKLVGAVWVLGPLFALAQALDAPHWGVLAFVLALVAATPSMATALLAGHLAQRSAA
jgi:hypothetical protein